MIYITILLLDPKLRHQGLSFNWAHQTSDETPSDSGLAWDRDSPRGAPLLLVWTHSQDIKAWTSTGHVVPATGHLPT